MKWNREEWAKTIAILGAAALVGGYLRYTVQGELMKVSEALLIAGGVLLLAGFILGFGGIIRFFSRRSSQLGTNTTILSVAIIVILGALNYLGSQHHKRFDLTSEKLYTLSDQTRKIVAGLKQDVEVFEFSKEPDPRLQDLLTEYKNLSPHFKFETVDPQRKPEIAHEYGAKRVGDVIMATGGRKEPVESPSGDISEQDLTGALLKITTDKVKTVCFVTGHGEKSLTATDPSGYSRADQDLKQEQFKTETVNLVTSTSVPAECTVLVIAGPSEAYFPQEVQEISKYLSGDGKALIEIDPLSEPKHVDSNLNSIFEAWNINVGDNIVIDASGMGRLFDTGPEYPIVHDYGDNPVTKSLAGSMTFFPLARTVSQADKSKSDPEIMEILKTSENSFTIPKLNPGQHEIRFDPKTDQRGPLDLGIAANRVNGSTNARLIVIGDSDFASNGAFGAVSDGNLFMNAIDWLAQDEQLIAIRPKSQSNRSVTLTESQKALLWWINIIFLPGIIILTGIIIWWKRR
ncbi:MAG TPA: Gldg family protein [Candidatus Acidoferrales bacterium]|nr:Gldg family protein [Candidatus Acidoferrales bacterium]